MYHGAQESTLRYNNATIVTTEHARLNTENALKLFLPGQILTLKSFDDRNVIFTVVKLFTPVTKSVTVLAKADTELVVVKIYDPRFLDDRLDEIEPLPWKLAIEQAAVVARPQNSQITDDELWEIIYDDRDEMTGEERTAHYVLREERYLRLLTECYEMELDAYEHLKDLQGSDIPRLITHGQFLPPDERAIQPPAIVLEYIPSVSLKDVSLSAITPDVRESLIAVLESFHSRGVLHDDIGLTNILFTPPEQPTRVVTIDFGCCNLKRDYSDKEQWEAQCRGEVKWLRRLLEDTEKYRNMVPNSLGC